MIYLKDDQQYIDRYGIHTAEEYPDWYWKIKDSFDLLRPI